MKEIAVDNGLYDLKTFEDELNYSFKINDHAVFKSKNLDLNTYVHYEFINNIVDFTILFIKELFLRYKVLSLEHIFNKFEQNDFQIQYNSSLIDKNLILFILNKFIIDTNIKNYLVKTSVYQIPGYKIIKIDKYYALINKNNYLSDDLLTTTNFSNKIPLTNFIQNINDIYLEAFKQIESKIKTNDDFIDLILSSNIDIPNINIKKYLEESNNKIIKNIISHFKTKKQKVNDIIGVINNKYHFIINKENNRKTENINNFFIELKGFNCFNLKKHELLTILDSFKIKDTIKNGFNTKNICDYIKKYLFYTHINSKDTVYFVIKFLL